MLIENKSSRSVAHDGLPFKKTASCHHISDPVPVIDRGQLLSGNDLAPVWVIIVDPARVERELFEGVALGIGFGQSPHRVPLPGYQHLDGPDNVLRPTKRRRWLEHDYDVVSYLVQTLHLFQRMDQNRGVRYPVT